MTELHTDDITCVNCDGTGWANNIECVFCYGTGVKPEEGGDA